MLQIDMPFVLEPYDAQQPHWPSTGRHVLAQYDDETIVVYQAYRPEIGHWSARERRLGGPGFSLGRMSWVKPNFLWMMYRSGWGTKEGQEITLALRLRRAAFDDILAAAVHSAFVPHVYADEAAWKSAVERSDVRVQWDPDHDPDGKPLARRALQLGLRGRALQQLVNEWTVDVHDVSSFVTEQRERLRPSPHSLVTPRERVYPVSPSSAAHLGVDDARATFP